VHFDPARDLICGTYSTWLGNQQAWALLQSIHGNDVNVTFFDRNATVVRAFWTPGHIPYDVAWRIGAPVAEVQESERPVAQRRLEEALAAQEQAEAEQVEDFVVLSDHEGEEEGNEEE